MVTTEQMFKGFNLLSSLSNIECINSGGCLFVCLGVYRALLNEGIDDKNIVIVQLELFGSPSIEENKKFIEGLNEKAYSSSHFALSFDGGLTCYDCDGMVNVERYPLHLIIPNNMIEKFSSNALTYGSWNPWFDRQTGVNEINNILGTNLEYYYN